MKLILYAIIASLFVAWAIRYLSYHTIKRIYMFLIMTLIAIIVRDVSNGKSLERSKY
jgi:hypothetical protein